MILPFPNILTDFNRFEQLSGRKSDIRMVLTQLSDSFWNGRLSVVSLNSALFYQNGPSWGSDFCSKNGQTYWYLQYFVTKVGLKPIF